MISSAENFLMRITIIGDRECLTWLHQRDLRLPPVHEALRLLTRIHYNETEMPRISTMLASMTRHVLGNSKSIFCFNLLARQNQKANYPCESFMPPL